MKTQKLAPRLSEFAVVSICTAITDIFSPLKVQEKETSFLNGKLLREILSMTLKNGKNFDRTSKIHNVDKYERVICGYKLGCCPLHLESLNLHLKMAKDETGQAGCSQSVTFLSCKNKEIELSVQFSHSVMSHSL